MADEEQVAQEQVAQEQQQLESVLHWFDVRDMYARTVMEVLLNKDYLSKYNMDDVAVICFDMATAMMNHRVDGKEHVVQMFNTPDGSAPQIAPDAVQAPQEVRDLDPAPVSPSLPPLPQAPQEVQAEVVSAPQPPFPSAPPRMPPLPSAGAVNA